MLYVVQPKWFGNGRGLFDVRETMIPGRPKIAKRIECRMVAERIRGNPERARVPL